MGWYNTNYTTRLRRESDSCTNSEINSTVSSVTVTYSDFNPWLIRDTWKAVVDRHFRITVKTRHSSDSDIIETLCSPTSNNSSTSANHNDNVTVTVGPNKMAMPLKTVINHNEA